MNQQADRKGWSRRLKVALYVGAILLATWSVLGAISRYTLHAERYSPVGSGESAIDFGGRRDVSVPLTVTTEERVTSASGLRRRLAAIQTLAIRTDGAKVLRLGPAGEGGRTIYLSDGIRVVTHDRLRTRSTVRGSVRPLLSRFPSQGCVESGAGETILGVQALEGLDSVKVAGPDSTSWYALDFGCVLLQRLTVHSGGSVSRTELVSFAAGEPAGSLFDVPSDFKEGPPSALSAAERAATPCSPECQKSQFEYFKMHDAEYERSRVK